MKTLAAILLLVASASSFAQASVLVYEEARCGAYLEVRRSGGAANGSASYVRGLITGHNIYGNAKQVDADLPDATVHAYLEKYCRDNPLSAVLNAATRLVIDLGGGIVPENRRK